MYRSMKNWSIDGSTRAAFQPSMQPTDRSTNRSMPYPSDVRMNRSTVRLTEPDQSIPKRKKVMLPMDSTQLVSILKAILFKNISLSPKPFIISRVSILKTIPLKHISLSPKPFIISRVPLNTAYTGEPLLTASNTARLPPARQARRNNRSTKGTAGGL